MADVRSRRTKLLNRRAASCQHEKQSLYKHNKNNILKRICALLRSSFQNPHAQVIAPACMARPLLYKRNCSEKSRLHQKMKPHNSTIKNYRSPNFFDLLVTFVVAGLPLLGYPDGALIFLPEGANVHVFQVFDNFRCRGLCCSGYFRLLWICEHGIARYS